MVSRRELLAGCVASLIPDVKGDSRTMDQRISLVTLGVKDLETSKRFYVEGFGWRPVFENKEIVFFQTGGMVFALFLRDHLAADFQADSNIRTSSHRFGLQRSREERSGSANKARRERWCENPETGRGGFLGWVFRLLQ